MGGTLRPNDPPTSKIGSWPMDIAFDYVSMLHDTTIFRNGLNVFIDTIYSFSNWLTYTHVAFLLLLFNDDNKFIKDKNMHYTRYLYKFIIIGSKQNIFQKYRCRIAAVTSLRASLKKLRPLSSG